MLTSTTMIYYIPILKIHFAFFNISSNLIDANINLNHKCSTNAFVLKCAKIQLKNNSQLTVHTIVRTSLTQLGNHSRATAKLTRNSTKSNQSTATTTIKIRHFKFDHIIRLIVCRPTANSENKKNRRQIDEIIGAGGMNGRS